MIRRRRLSALFLCFAVALSVMQASPSIAKKPPKPAKLSIFEGANISIHLFLKAPKTTPTTPKNFVRVYISNVPFTGFNCGGFTQIALRYIDNSLRLFNDPEAFEISKKGGVVSFNHSENYQSPGHEVTWSVTGVQQPDRSITGTFSYHEKVNAPPPPADDGRVLLDCSSGSQAFNAPNVP